MAQEEFIFTDNGTAEVLWTRGQGLFMATGDFGGGVLQMGYSLDGVNYIDEAVGSLSANGAEIFTLPRDARIRLTLSGATTPNLTAWIKPNRNEYP